MSTPPPINPHAWRKMNQAEKNFIRLFQTGGRTRRVRYWAKLSMKWLEKVLQ